MHLLPLINSSIFIVLVMVHFTSTGVTENTRNNLQTEEVDQETLNPSVASRNNKWGFIYSYSTTTAEDLTTKEPILKEWGGNCTKKDWDKCSHLERWVTSHLIDKKKPQLGYKYHETDCKVQPILCLKNGWTVTRCQLLCMRCNREILSKYDKYVAKEGAC